MPLLLSRQQSTASLATIVEKCQQQQQRIEPILQYDLQLKNNQLELILKSKPPIPPKPPTDLKTLKGFVQAVPDEGFESDIDTISLISSENESFSADKNNASKSLLETDSANGGSGTESETETEKNSTLTQNNANNIKENLKPILRAKEIFDLVDCVCYNDVVHPDFLIFVIKNEALVFKFLNLDELQIFYKNFTTLKAVTSQKNYNNNVIINKTFAPKYNLLQRTENGITHIEIKKGNFNGNNNNNNSNISGPSSLISFDTSDGGTVKKNAHLNNVEDKSSKKDVNSRQRTESKLLNDVKFNTINNKLGQKQKILRSSSIENILNIDHNKEISNLVNENSLVGTLRKVWNSAEDLLDSDSPRRPDRRRKKKPAPPPPQNYSSTNVEDIFKGQFVRVTVDPLKDHLNNRLVIKSTINEPHPKKLGQNFHLSSLLLKSTNKDPKIIRYPSVENATLNRPQRISLYEKNNQQSSWTNSVPRILKKSTRCKSETRNNSHQPMAYRYIDTTTKNFANNNNSTLLKSKNFNQQQESATLTRHQPRMSSFASYNASGFIKNHHQDNAMNNRVFGLTPKLKDFTRVNLNQNNTNKWSSSMNDLSVLANDKNSKNLKSSIKSSENKKKNEKKVTFSAYTTVQVV